MNEDQHLYQRLTPIFRDVFDNDDIVPSPEMTADDVDGWDSLNHLRLIVSIEVEFGIKFPTADIAELRNVGELVSLLKTRL